jgi:hypothetical protein
MFLSKVAIGHTKELTDEDNSLKLPPLRESSHSSLGFEQERYDSVTGYSAGTKIYIVYPSRK